MHAGSEIEFRYGRACRCSFRSGPHKGSRELIADIYPELLASPDIAEYYLLVQSGIRRRIFE